jgi:hypothetical protein
VSANCLRSGELACPPDVHQYGYVIGVIETAAHGLAILLDELTGVELGVDHHSVGRSVTEQRLNDVHGRVVIQVFGCKDAPAIVRQQHERRTASVVASGTPVCSSRPDVYQSAFDRTHAGRDSV